MTWIYLVVVALGFVFTVAALSARWLLRQVILEDPAVQVSLTGNPPPGEFQVELKLVGTRRVFALRSVETSREFASSLGLQAPPDFREAPVSPERGAKAVDRQFLSDWNSENLRWVPQRKLMLQPERPYRFSMGIVQADAARGTLRFLLEAKPGIGSMVLMVPVPVGVSAPHAVRARMVRQHLRRQARRFGGLPAQPPVWSRVVEG